MNPTPDITLLDRYTLQSRLGAGDMEQLVALKILPAHFANTPHIVHTISSESLYHVHRLLNH